MNFKFNTMCCKTLSIWTCLLLTSLCILTVALLYTSHIAFGFLNTPSLFSQQDLGTCCSLFPECPSIGFEQDHHFFLSLRSLHKATSSEKSSLIIGSKLVSPQVPTFCLDLFPLEPIPYKIIFIFIFKFNICFSSLESIFHEKRNFIDFVHHSIPINSGS